MSIPKKHYIRDEVGPAGEGSIELFLKRCRIDAERYAREQDYFKLKEVLHLMIDARFTEFNVEMMVWNLE